jgi:hypothetical protein
VIARRGLFGLLAALPAAAAATGSRPIVVEEWTFLKSTDEKPDQLAAFLVANWLAMDRIAIDQGLFGNARLLQGDGADWNLAIVVGYFSAGGYDDVRAGFEAIRSRHVLVQPHGRTLAQLGRIVGSRRLELKMLLP